MAPNTCLFALAAALLSICTLASAQTASPAPAGTSAPARSGGPYAAGSDGVFRPAGSDDGDKQGKAAQGPSQSSPVYTIGKEYRIGPNDLLDIEVLNLDNGKRTVRVNAAGYVTMPLIGPVTVVGLTQQQAEGQIATLYGDKYLQNPQVSVFIREFTTERITVDGAIAKPGIYPLVGQMTLLRVLALAGGFGSIAKRNSVMLFRNGEKGERQVATFDVEKIQSGEAPDPPVRGDDLIVVQRDSARAAFTDSLFRDVVNVFNPLTYIPR
jgi:polysaccharide export outer membrane protein